MCLALAVGTALPILAQGRSEAQRRALLERPPQVSFSPWREVESDDFSKVYDVQFPSPFVSGRIENDTVRVRAFLPADATKATPVVIILHYWGATDLALESRMARELNGAGVSATVMTLPYHLSRTPKGFRSGELMLQADPASLIASMTQSVQDVRRTIDWIESRPEFDKSKLAVAGTSLGGIVASLAFATEDRFQAGAFVLAGSDVAGLLWTSSRVVVQRERLRQQGYTEGRLREELAVIEPSSYLQKGDARPSFVIAASLDTVVPPKNAKALIDALGTPATLWLQTGHFGGALSRGRIVRSVARFFESTFSGGKFVPSTISPPTLWFGLLLSTEKGLQVAASIDVWRSNRNGDAFASLSLTPQGPEGFLGARLSQGLAAGIVFTPSRPALGLSWRIAF